MCSLFCSFTMKYAVPLIKLFLCLTLSTLMSKQCQSTFLPYTKILLLFTSLNNRCFLTTSPEFSFYFFSLVFALEITVQSLISFCFFFLFRTKVSSLVQFGRDDSYNSNTIKVSHLFEHLRKSYKTFVRTERHNEESSFCLFTAKQ